MSLKELQLPSIASLRAIAALKSTHLALVRPARIGLGFEPAGGNQKSLAEIEATLGGPGRLSLSYSLRWLLDVLTGLGVLHRTLSFVHGEVQPEHIVLGDDGVGRLVPVVRAHWVRGEERASDRLYYLAPEKLLGDRIDVRSDVFSVGVMLWEALSGQRLLEAFTVDDIIARLMGGGIPRAHAPEAEAWTAPLADVAERALAVDPGRRFATVAAMKEAIESACSRYLASPPGMAEMFQNPERRARSRVRDSLAPDSQRLTQPPTAALTGPPTAGAVVEAVVDDALEAAAERLSRSSYAAIDLEAELATKPNAAPLPVVSKGAHVNTLLGVPPPFIERESAAPEPPTRPYSRVPAPAPVLVTPPPAPPASPSAPVHVPALGKTHFLGSPPAATRSSAPPASAPVESAHAASLSPFVSARPQVASRTVEPSFELVRPRKRRGAAWLLVGVAAAIVLFAARPWLARQVAAAVGGLPDSAVTNVDLTEGASQLAPLPSASPSVPVVPSAEPRAIGIASTPAAPSPDPRPARGRAPREEHVVIHDAVEPSLRGPAAAAPAAPKPEQVALPPAEAPPAAPPTPPPVAAPKAKPVPVSDADQYGI